MLNSGDIQINTQNVSSAFSQINDSCSDIGIVHLFHWKKRIYTSIRNTNNISAGRHILAIMIVLCRRWDFDWFLRRVLCVLWLWSGLSGVMPVTAERVWADWAAWLWFLRSLLIIITVNNLKITRRKLMSYSWLALFQWIMGGGFYQMDAVWQSNSRGKSLKCEIMINHW